MFAQHGQRHHSSMSNAPHGHYATGYLAPRRVRLLGRTAAPWRGVWVPRVADGHPKVSSGVLIAASLLKSKLPLVWWAGQENAFKCHAVPEPLTVFSSTCSGVILPVICRDHLFEPYKGRNIQGEDHGGAGQIFPRVRGRGKSNRFALADGSTLFGLYLLFMLKHWTSVCPSLVTEYKVAKTRVLDGFQQQQGNRSAKVTSFPKVRLSSQRPITRADQVGPKAHNLPKLSPTPQNSLQDSRLATGSYQIHQESCPCGSESCTKI